MTPTEFIAAARRKYNAVGNTFYSDTEILDLLYQVEGEMARYAYTIEVAPNSSTSTVVGTRGYAIPSRTLSISRLTYNGSKLQPISFREDDAITSLSEDTTTTGTPLFYELWADTVYLRPVPNAIKVLKFYTYGEPAVLTISDTIETPTRFHMDLVDGVVAELMYKDENAAIGDRYRKRFDVHLEEARKWQRRRRRGDSFATVKDEEALNRSILGVI